jgi:hypothetical protein
MKTKSVSVAVEISGKTVFFEFNEKYLQDGEVEKSILEVAREAHKQFVCLLDGLDPKCENGDPGLKESMGKLRHWKLRRIELLKKIFQEFREGTFTFSCLERKCECHPESGGFCDANLHDDKLVLPEVKNCANFRARSCHERTHSTTSKRETVADFLLKRGLQSHENRRRSGNPGIKQN